MNFPAVLDTNVLFSSTLCDTVLRIAEEGVFGPYWSTGVLDELAEVLVREAELPLVRVERRIVNMRRAFPLSEIVGYEPLISAMSCDPGDRHVLAAAVHGKCAVLVTFNGKDFPPESTASHHIDVVTPDEFLLDQLDLYPARVGRALVEQMTEAKRPPLSMGQLLGRLARSGVPAFAEEARRHEFA